MKKYRVKREDMIGSIENLPIEVVQKMVDYQIEQGNPPDVTVFQKNVLSDLSSGGFDWSKTDDRFMFWLIVLIDREFDEFFKKYPHLSGTGESDKCEKHFELETVDADRDRCRREAVDHPDHYQDPSGVECIDIIKHRNFCVGNAIKYLWRAGLKTEEGKTTLEKQIEDLRKAAWYIECEIDLLKSKM